MKLLHVIILLCIYILRVESQVQIGRNQQPSKLNEHKIYFSDNVPGNGPERTTVEVQKSVEPATTQQDSYAQAALGVQSFGPVSVQAPSKGQLPSGNILPPKKSDQNYYTKYSDSYDDGTSSKSGEDDGIPAAPIVSKFNNMSLAVSNFGLNLLKSINGGVRNVVLSPFSIAELLSLLQQGALGQTQQQITDALQMAPETSVHFYNKVNENFQKRTSHNILKVANNVFVSDSFQLNPAFKTVAMRAFGSEVTPMRFSKAQSAVQRINGWVAQKTNNKITDLLNEDAVNENTQVLMLNAVYFKGLWAIKFQPESTSPRDFYVNEVTKKTVPFMRIRKIFRAGTDRSNNAQVIILPFEMDEYSLMVILPSEFSSLDALVSSLTLGQLTSYFTMSPKEVDLEIPKFSAKADTDLNPVFRKMGITNVFGQKSELAGLGLYRTYSPQLSSALHSAVLSIDEEGGSAAAATSFAVVALSYDDPSVVIKVKRPFLTVLWDHENGIPLFIARIQDPTA
ncbi:serpin (serine protease inhibitor) domain-containing protein [Phthorimaea operculella]|nr:serpin (serine protease inhibitor) domain-containing protein [Phthorimaea operculella]